LQLTGVSFLITPFFAPSQAHAFEWQDLWKTQNQQAAMAYQQEDYKQAANKFNNPSWKGAAQFKAGDFSDSAESFSAQENADGYYNQGNALAHLGKLEEAIAAFDKALLLEPAMADAKANKKVVEDLLAQKKQQEQQQGSQGDSSQKRENEQQQNDQKQSDQNQSSDQGEQENDSSSEQDQKQQHGSDSDSGNSKTEKGSSEQESASQNEQGTQSDEDVDANEEKKAQETLEQLKKEQQQKEQQALDQLNASQEQPSDNEQPSETAQASAQQPQKTQEQQQLENWLGQLPEDASRLVRNKFNYEYQKKRQAYINGQWQPPKEQRW